MSTPILVPNSVLKFKSLEEDLSTTVATALWRKVAQVQEYLRASHPVGMVIWFRATQDLLPEMPDPKYWKEMDGTVVNNTNSPFHGQALPNLRGKYLKHPAIGQNPHQFGGADTRNLTHNHGGATAPAWPGADFNADNDDERSGPFFHAHPMTFNLQDLSACDIRPPYQGLRFFLRIV